MIKHVIPTSIGDVFSVNNVKLYKIPKYQRLYTWGLKEWNDLFDDVMENEEGYFLGSFICSSGSALQEVTLEVVDGQQRFTTISLLLAALYTKLNEYKDEMDEDEAAGLANIRKQLTVRKKIGKNKTEYSQRLFLQTENSNDIDYTYVLSENEIITLNAEKPTNFGNRRISKAFTYFVNRLEEAVEEALDEDEDEREIDVLFRVAKKFESAVLVGIEVDSNKDANMLFESLNNRGVSLSALDLIKNTLISQSEKDNNVDNTYETWKKILNLVGQDDNSVQERFFRQYYNAFREELNAGHKSKDKMYYYGYFATRTTLIGIYEKMIQEDYERLLKDLSDKAEVYSVIIGQGEENTVYTNSLLNLSRVMAAPSYILLLYIMSNQKKLKLSDENIKDISDNLVKFFIRRNLTNYPSTSSLNKIFMEIVGKVKELKGDKIVKTIKDCLIERSVSDEEFEDALRDSIYYLNPEMTRFILCSLEEQHQTKETYKDLWKRDDSKKYIWTIEHIFPEGENIPKCWVDMIADGDRKKASEIRENYVHTLGNLTITGYNSKLSNYSFEQKKDRQNKSREYIGYKNGLYLNKDVVKKKKWTLKEINSRTDSLVEQVLELYKW